MNPTREDSRKQRGSQEKKSQRDLFLLHLLTIFRKASFKLKNLFTLPRHPNLLGDRDVEWSWICARMPAGPGEALDFGSASSFIGLVACQRDFKVTAVDLEPVHWHFVHPNLRFVCGDLLNLSMPKTYYDLVLNCSTVEHVGLAGRYGVKEALPDGDLLAMKRLRELMKPSGIMLLTIPVGQDALFSPMCRVYGEQRLPLLLDGYFVEEEVFWVKDEKNCWVKTDRDTALHFKSFAGSSDPRQCVYALSCFVLRQHEANEKLSL